MFDDKTFDELDDISKLIEPFTYSFNDILSNMPDEEQVDYNDLLNACKHKNCFDYRYLSINTFVTLKLKNKSNKDHISKICDFYEFNIDKDVRVDFENQVLIGKISMVKTHDGYTDKQMEKLIRTRIIDSIKLAMKSPSNYDKKSANELADLFDISGVSSERSTSRKKRLLIAGFEKIIDDNKICIRDVDFGMRFSNWIAKFLRYGNLGAIKNLCKVKIISHKNNVIYSIQDEVEV